MNWQDLLSEPDPEQAARVAMVYGASMSSPEFRERDGGRTAELLPDTRARILAKWRAAEEKIAARQRPERRLAPARKIA